MDDETPEPWFLVRQRIELAWERDGGLTLDAGEVRVLREELVKLKQVLRKAVDVSGGLMDNQHGRDLQTILVRLGYLAEQDVIRHERHGT